jgi:hypothetical protein
MQSLFSRPRSRLGRHLGALVRSALITTVFVLGTQAAMAQSDTDDQAVDDSVGMPAEVDVAPTESPPVPVGADTSAGADTAPTPIPNPTPSAPFVQATLTKGNANLLFPNPGRANYHIGGSSSLPGKDHSLAAINQLPSPVGAPLFADAEEAIGGTWDVTLLLASGKAVTSPFGYDPPVYSYTCSTGQCTGSAADVWQAMPAVQRESYLASVLAAAKPALTWNPKVFMVSVKNWGDLQNQNLGCASQGFFGRDGDPNNAIDIRFARSCSGPFQDHLP